MPEVIDKELEKIAKLGETPRTIYVGIGLYREIQNAQFEPIADGQAASDFPAEEPTKYKGIKLHVVETEEPDYLRIET